MAVNPSPFGPKPQWELVDGLPVVGYKLFSYVAGSVGTKQDTFTDSVGNVANPNPIILNSLGQTPNEYWFTAGESYKVVLAPANDTDPPTSPVWTIDDLRGINDNTVSADQWVASGFTPTFINGTQFTVPGDQTSVLQVGRRVRCLVTAGTVYGTITVSAYGALTTVTVVLDSGALDSGLSQVSYGLLSSNNSSIPAVRLTNGGYTFQRTQTLSKGADIASAGALTLGTDGNYFDVTGTTTITSIGTVGVGTWIKLHFDDALILTHSATDLVLPGGANITTAAGDEAEFVEYASGDWRCTVYTKASGAPIAAFPASRITASLGANVLLNNTANYFDGPTIAQGSTGTWFVSGTVTVRDTTAGANQIYARLTDGTTIIASGGVEVDNATRVATISLSGFITNPAGNLRISCRDSTTTSGTIEFNFSGNSKDSTITAYRIA